MEIDYKGKTVELMFTDAGTDSYLCQWRNYKDGFRGYLFLGEETYEEYINEYNRIKVIRDELEAIKSKYKIEKELKEGRVMEVIVLEEEEVYAIEEKCDEYFGISLDKKDFYELSNYFKDVAELMEKNGH